MKGISLYIFCLFLIAEACTPKNIKFSDEEKDLFLKSAQTINDQITSAKVTLLHCPLDSIETISRIINGCSYKTINDSSKRKLNSLLSNQTAKPHVLIDKEYISPGFLQAQDSLAFLALSKSEWRNEISVNDFVEYILPYKQELEFVDNWRDSLFLHHSNLISAQAPLENLDSLYAFYRRTIFWSLSSKLESDNLYPSQDNFTWLNYSMEGDCIARSILMIYYLRAAGAPATFDYIPAWGNRAYAKHAYVGFAHKKRQLKKLLCNNNDTLNLVEDLNATMSSNYMPNFNNEEIPSQCYIQYEKTIPKVYRRTWSTQSEIIDIIREVPLKQLYLNLIQPNMVDVTSEYLETADVNVFNNPFNRFKIAYLATFDVNGWRPVCFSTFNWLGNARFRGLGKNILYLPVASCNQDLIPIDNPFILDSGGKKINLKCELKKKINLRLFRKYPLFSYSVTHVKGLKNCSIWGANDSNFEDKEELAIVDKYPFFAESFNIKTPNEYRYIKIKSNENKKVRISEISCYSDSCGVKIENKDVRISSNELSKRDRRLFDKDFGNYSVGTEFVMDLGRSVLVTEIQIGPMNDTNYIIPGNQYELFYWNNGWQSAGSQKANKYFLEYNDIPSGTIYWLKCLNEGKEERIFTYEGGKQIWW